MQTRVLVADDEPDTLRGLERILGREGYRVDAVGGGIEAAEKLGAEDYDVVVSDLRMPTVNGMDLLRMAKDKRKSIVFVMITAYGTPETASEAMRLGSSDFISKPFAPSDLAAAVAAGLNKMQVARRDGPTVQGGVPWEAVSRWIDEHGSEAALAAARDFGGLSSDLIIRGHDRPGDHGDLRQADLPRQQTREKGRG